MEDPLEPAAAIVVLDGGVPLREQEGARLFQDDWAPRLVITRGPAMPIDRAAALEQSGVPAQVVTVIHRSADGTYDELALVADTIGPDDSAVILVTSPFHTRRVAMTWWLVTHGRPRAIVRPAWQEPFGADSWWREPRSRLQVWHEYVGMLAYVVGLRGE